VLSEGYPKPSESEGHAPPPLASLVHLKVWCGWRPETLNGRTTKVPYDVRNGRHASSTNPSTWATHDEAQQWAELRGAGAGVGLMFTRIRDLFTCGVDLDSCRDPNTGAVAPWAQDVIDRLATYAEVSPSKRGIKAFFTIAAADMPTVETLFGGKFGLMFKKGDGVHPPAIEIHRGNRYFAVTWENVGETEELRTVSLTDLEWLVLDAGPKFAVKDGGSGGGNNAGSKDSSRSAKAFGIGAALKAGGASYEEMRDALLTHEDPEIAEWARSKGVANGERELRRVFDNVGCSDEGVHLENFVAYMQSHDFVYLPAGDFWPAARVDARLFPIPLSDKNGKPIMDKKTKEQKTIKPSAWLAKHAPVEQMTWAPGQQKLIRNRLISEGGWIDRKGVTVLNLYIPPQTQRGEAAKAGKWIEHIKKIYPENAEHIIAFLAHRVRRPHEKINHGLVLGGVPGIGKDTFLEPVKRAVGAWNFIEVSPQHLLGRFNGFLKSVVLRINEVKDMGEFDRFKLYEHMKNILAAPPDVLRVDEKNLREHSVLNVCGVIMTTNYKTNGIYLPANDRRHYVAWSESKQEDFSKSYWKELWQWYESGGFGHVAAYLKELDLSDFNPKATPTKTPAFWAIVDAGRSPEDAELADLIDSLEQPNALTLNMLIIRATDEIATWLRDRKNRRTIPHRLEQCGYVPVRNDTAESGLFVINRQRQVVYAKAELSVRDQFAAARILARQD
jgi:hypothetical protein